MRYHEFQIKALDAGAEWSFTGIASTAAPDQQGDILEPKGAEFEIPLPLLLNHNSTQPVGQIVSASVSDAGIAVKGQITKPTPDMPAGMQARLSEAYQSIKTGLIKGLSVGFIPKDYVAMQSGFKVTAWSWVELSLTATPANLGAKIQTVKSLQNSPYINPRIIRGKGGAYSFSIGELK